MWRTSDADASTEDYGRLMFTTEVHPADWSGFFERVMSELPTMWVTIEVEAPAIGHQIEARDLVLEGLNYDLRDDTFEIVAFHPGPTSRAVLRHMIEHPARINVDSPTGILPTAIDIESREGIRTLVRLHGAPALSS